MTNNVLNREEKIIYELRSVYHNYGYTPYAMSKFEDYEFYIRNKDFLISDRVIAFNDTNGKMLALKPDVTLSIIKSGKDTDGIKQKVYYNENVYRVSRTTHRYKEIMQVGLECIGDIDFYDIFEVVSLAAESLSKISGNFSLVISHLGILSDILSDASNSRSFKEEAIECIKSKNTHDLQKLCEKYNVSEEKTKAVIALTQIYGERGSVIEKISEFADELKVSELKKLSDFLLTTPYSDKIEFDFSVVDDMNYYNGFLFKGFVDGVASEILSGGQYDNMMKKISRTSSAIGFAIYLDLLDKTIPDESFMFDVLLVYGEENDAFEVAKKVSELAKKGLSCSAQKVIPNKIKFKEIIDMRGGTQNA